MKRSISVTALFLSFIMLLSLCGCGKTADAEPSDQTAEATDAADGSGFTYTVEDGKAEITGYTGSETEVEIPSEIDGVKVTSIKDSAFWGNKVFKGVIIPNGISNIGSWAFNDCIALESVTLPSSINTLNERTFSGCSSLSSITIPSSVTEIGPSAFIDCSSLKSVDIPNGVTKIGEDAFNGCTSLTDIELPNGLTEISKYALGKCSTLKSVTIPSGVKTIGESAFFGCSSLESVLIPASVNEIKNYAFTDCASLDKVSLPDGIKDISPYTFANCSSLKSITLPSSLKSIGDYAFKNCVSLSSITIPEGAKDISSTAFSGCDNLKKTTEKDASKPSGGEKSGSDTGRVDFEAFSINVPKGVMYKSNGDHNGNQIVTFYDKYNYERGKEKGYEDFGRLFIIHVSPTRETSLELDEKLPKSKWLGNYNGYYLVADYPTDVQWDMSDSDAESSYKDLKSGIDDMLDSIE